MTSKEARQLTHENRRLARVGEDPQAPRNVASPSLADALDTVIEVHAASRKTVHPLTAEVRDEPAGSC